MSRKEFSPNIKNLIKSSSGYICNNPSCNKFLWMENKTLAIVGHIIAASPTGPREAKNEDEKHVIRRETNGILLCPTCERMVDLNIKDFPIDMLVNWKNTMEEKIYKFMTNVYEIEILKNMRNLKEASKRDKTVLESRNKTINRQQNEIKEKNIEISKLQNIIKSLNEKITKMEEDTETKDKYIINLIKYLSQ